jgi:stress response protein YsnF
MYFEILLSHIMNMQWLQGQMPEHSEQLLHLKEENVELYKTTDKKKSVRLCDGKF